MMETIVTFGGVIAAFSIFDALLTSNARGKLSEYIFGFHNVPTGSIEATVARALVAAFSNRENQLSISRVFAWSLAMSPVCAVLGDVIFAPDIFQADISKSANAILIQNLFWNPALFLTIFLSISIVSLPYDYWNAWVSKRIYLRGVNGIGNRHFIYNAVISGIPAALFYWALASGWLYNVLIDKFLMTSVDNTDGFIRLLVIHLFVYLPASICSSILLSFLVRIFTSLFVLLVRFALFLTTLNRGIVLHTRAHDFPFTSVGIFFGIVYSLWDILFW